MNLMLQSHSPPSLHFMNQHRLQVIRPIDFARPTTTCRNRPTFWARDRKTFPASQLGDINPEPSPSRHTHAPHVVSESHFSKIRANPPLQKLKYNASPVIPVGATPAQPS